MKEYMNKSLSPEKRAKLLLDAMTTEEKLWQLSADMIFEIGSDYEQKREHRHGHFRNPGHFMHYTEKGVQTPREVAKRINRDIKLSMDSGPHGIPPIENGEALHGAQWGMATCFPQPIGMASTFDDELMLECADVIGKELRAVGVRQVFAPVINIVRDCRWGRTVETFGEDVLLTSNMGCSMCKGLEDNGVIATPKHFVDNYAAGGRDSNYSDNSERTLREVYLKPFEKCVKAGVAHSVMPAYNSWDGLPCSANKKLLTDILRTEWGFDGFAVSDYSGVTGVNKAHMLTDSVYKAQAMCIKAGLEVNLPYSSIEHLKTAYKEGFLSEEDIDNAVFNVLKMKFSIGLFDEPFVDEDKADSLIRTEENKALALKAAKESIVLLKNNGILPYDKNKIKKIAVFGKGADVLPVGLNYSGPYRVNWKTADAKTPLQYLREYMGSAAEIIYASEDDIEKIAPNSDICLYFTTVVEGEGMDRCSITLPDFSRKVKQEDENAVIVGKFEIEIKENQNEAVKRLVKANKNTAVILLNGAPVDMSYWIDGANAVIEAWYPGEQGSEAIVKLLFGEYSPSGKLPITVPRTVGQLPLYYSYKPSGRGYGYNDNDGTPLYEFGYGLSYTNFEISDICPAVKSNSIEIELSVNNIGSFDGAEVVQVYISGKNCDVVRPVKELKAYQRVEVQSNGKKTVTLTLGEEEFSYYDINLSFAMHDGDYTVMIGNSSNSIINTFEAKIRNKEIKIKFE